eukprot:scaffold78116_cov22-Tisochrysis_lutea.AAC.5
MSEAGAKLTCKKSKAGAQLARQHLGTPLQEHQIISTSAHQLMAWHGNASSGQEDRNVRDTMFDVAQSKKRARGKKTEQCVASEAEQTAVKA